MSDKLISISGAGIVEVNLGQLLKSSEAKRQISALGNIIIQKDVAEKATVGGNTQKAKRT